MLSASKSPYSPLNRSVARNALQPISTDFPDERGPPQVHAGKGPFQMNDLRRVGNKHGILFNMATAIKHPEGIIRDVLYPVSLTKSFSVCSFTTPNPK